MTFGRALIPTALPALLLCLAGCAEDAAPAAQSAGTAQAAAQGQSSSSSPPSVAASDGNSTAPSESTNTEPGQVPASAVASPADAAQAAPAQPAAKRAGPTAGSITDRSFDDLKFDIKKGDPFHRKMLTEKIETLFGTQIRIRGYILPSFQQTGLTQFVLVRDNMECCFGPGAALYDCILVEMAEGKSTNFSVRPVAVEGVLTFNEVIGPDGKHLAVFHILADSVN